MKYLIIICDGAADWSIDSLGNKTIFEATHTPNLDWIASQGKMGLLRTIPEGMNPGSECANMTIMGYNPEKDLTGRGPLEALSANVPLNDTDIAFRCNLITIEDDLIKDYSSGHISTPEGQELIQFLQNHLAEDGINFYPGVQYRHILKLNGTLFSEKILTTPPHDVLDEPYKEHLPKPSNYKNKRAQKTAEKIIELIEKSNSLLVPHNINQNRKEIGKNIASNIWPWSGGKKPTIEPFYVKYGLNGSVISAVDLVFGLGIAAGLKPVHVEGATGLPDTNYAGKVDAAIKELKEKDFVYLHIEAIDEMGHTGVPQKKIAALKDFDEKVMGPLLRAEAEFSNELVIGVLPDHPTPCEIRTHSPEPVPFAIYNPQYKHNTKRPFSELSGKNGEYGLIDNGESFMKTFLNQ
ncbi:MAG: cofactor-independent phosphoglycerate mutase [Candidatus Lokiarchaeota archaeon]|nr:cofactor-independent phosphoglycerate mutase [Candidatus Lokiarchaeota archaeon]